MITPVRELEKKHTRGVGIDKSRKALRRSGGNREDSYEGIDGEKVITRETQDRRAERDTTYNGVDKLTKNRNKDNSRDIDI